MPLKRTAGAFSALKDEGPPRINLGNRCRATRETAIHLRAAGGPPAVPCSPLSRYTGMKRGFPALGDKQHAPLPSR
jgi:hypothetical protein